MNEAELEARLLGVLKKGMPWLANIRLQWNFKLQVGHNEFHVDGKKVQRVTGRADVVVLSKETPVAIFELKAPHLALTDQDRKQGLSYARLLDPMAPLVIVSNGVNTKFYTTVNGATLPGNTLTNAQFKQTLEAATSLAEKDIQDAIAALLGPRSAVAVEMINALSLSLLNEMTGRWSDHLRPFADRLIIPRALAKVVDQLLDSREKTILISGGPLAGKSNILGQLYLHTVKRSSVAFLYLEGTSTRQGILQVLANAFASQFGWAATPNDVRQWLRGMSKSEDLKLIVAVDDVDPAAMAAELDELSSNAYGPKLKLVLTGTPAVVAQLRAAKEGRQATRLGRNGRLLEVCPLDDDEFRAALNVLGALRIQFMQGAQHAMEYRQPWVLRAVAGHVSSDDKYTDDTLAAALPSLPGLFILHLAEHRFADLDELRGRYSEFCRALMKDIDESYESLTVSLVTSFTCRRSTLLEFLSEAELSQAVANGELKFILLEDDERAVVAQLPELAALTIAKLLGQRLYTIRSEGGERQAEELVATCSRVLLGDVIGARALHEYARLEGSLPAEVIMTLISWAPEEHELKAGSRMALPLQDGKAVDFTIPPDGSWLAKLPNGQIHRVAGEPGDFGVSYSRTIPWFILSYFLATPLGVAKEDGEFLGWADASIISPIAGSPIPQIALRGARSQGLLMHDVPGKGSFVCHKEGIVEPVTFGLMKLMTQGQGRGEYLVKEALEQKSLPFVYRLYSALSFIEQLDDADQCAWAGDLLKPLEEFLASSNLLHGEGLD